MKIEIQKKASQNKKSWKNGHNTGKIWTENLKMVKK